MQTHFIYDNQALNGKGVMLILVSMDKNKSLRSYFGMTIIHVNITNIILIYFIQFIVII